MTENQYIKIVDEVYDKNLGGRNFDYKLAKLIYKKYKKKVANIDLTEDDLNIFQLKLLLEFYLMQLNIKKFFQPIKILLFMY
jgi:molecular chaperone DnaK (HSP70)